MDGSNTKKLNIQVFNCPFLASKTIPKAVWSRQLFTLWTLSKKSKIKCTKISALLKILQPSMIKSTKKWRFLWKNPTAKMFILALSKKIKMKSKLEKIPEFAMLHKAISLKTSWMISLTVKSKKFCKKSKWTKLVSASQLISSSTF